MIEPFFCCVGQWVNGSRPRPWESRLADGCTPKIGESQRIGESRGRLPR
jgi:hypothetical protein